MSAEQNKTVARRYVDDVLNTGNAGPTKDLFASDFSFHFPGSPTPLDSEGWKGPFTLFHTAFPDQRTTLDDIVADEDTVAGRFTFTGTHEGDFQGIPPTGKPVEMSGMAIWRIADGKIAEHWVQFDALGLMQQLGVIPSEP